jgi:hypothetical protein
MIEVSNASEARVGGDLRNREVGLGEKISREVDPARAGNFCRRRSQVLKEQPPQVTGAEAYPPGECLNIVHIERTLRDQFKGSRNHR